MGARDHASPRVLSEFSPPERDLIEQVTDSQSQRAGFKHSLRRLLGNWETFVRDVESGYSLTIYDYENDLSTRDLLEEVMTAGSSIRRKLADLIGPLDERFKAATIQNPARVIEAGAWWQNRVPRNPAGELAEDLAER